MFVLLTLLACTTDPIGRIDQAVTGEGATVTTDQPEYAPGDTALISGSGWQPGESIAIAVQCDCGCSDYLTGTADETGAFSGVEYAIGPEHIGATCTVIAQGLSSEQVATTTFTDGNVLVNSEPNPTTFVLGVNTYTGRDCTGTEGHPTTGVCFSGTCTINSTLNGTFVASTLNTTGTVIQSVRLVAAGTATNGTQFSHWTGPGIPVTNLSANVCINGQTNNATYTAHYTTACTAPTISCPADITRDTAPGTCAASNVTYTPTVSGCGSPTVSCSPASGGSFGAGTTAVTCTATNSGGSRSCTFNVTVNDVEAPAIFCPANVLDECPLDPGSGSPTVTDNCSSVSVSSSDQSVAQCGGTSNVTRTFTATDGGGRTATCAQQISVVDTTAPAVTAPADKVLECNADTSPAATGVASSSDSCSGATATSSDVETAGCGATRTIARTWTAADGCGNTSSATQTIQTVDTTAPTLAPPEDAVVECGSATTPDQTGRAAGADSCGSVSVSSSDAFSAVCGGSGVITRTWTATNACGLPSSAAQSITVVDLTAPSLVKPAGAAVECGGDTSPAATGTAASADVCSAPVVASSDSETAGCGGSRAIHRAWTATDACGNATTGVQEIAVVDSAAPTITLAGSATMQVDCRGSFSDPGASVTDACQGDLGAAAVSGAVDVNVPGVYTLSYSAGDGCGNTASATRTVTVADATAPAIVCPASQVVSAGCGGHATFTGATASDACGVATVTCTENGVPIGNEADVGHHHIVCVAADLAGQTASCAFDVDVVATGADIFWLAPLASDPRSRDTAPGDQIFNAAQDIPIKIDVTGCDGADATATVSAQVSLALDADGDGRYEKTLAGGAMEHLDGKLIYHLDTHGFPAGTDADGRSFLLTVSVTQGQVTLRSESIHLESR